ncbi:hypothetical protein [Streptomyces sp. 5-10]|uniref:hypothetical protein n=1 Tax=Streptomyces sp. 5-10 TaxID=878925 RepID=UPI00168A835A|nr:hypothetical protein [Streptomyces sp. 5-10]MBD3004734.1 hypothetical protein [Streptomyces sp. 5-10]
MEQMRRVNFEGGLSVVTSDVKTLTWCMKEAGYTAEGQPDTWRVVLGSGKVFAVADTKGDAEIVQNALRGVGIQTTVWVEPNE